MNHALGGPASGDAEAGPVVPYLICTLPRSGSWLLAEALRATGQAGRPEEYFWSDLRPIYEQDWGLAGCDDTDFLRRVRTVATTPNGVFGAKAHWFEFEQLVDLLRGGIEPEGVGGSTGPSTRPASDVDLINGYLPDLRYIHLTRLDKAAQAISWFLARQTQIWWHVAEDEDEDEPPPPVVDFDPESIARLERELRENEWQWVSYFSRAGVEPLVISYESLAGDVGGAARQVVEHLGLEAGDDAVGATEVIMRRQADQRSAEWKDRYLDWKASRRRHRHRAIPAVSVVVVSHNEGLNLRRTVDDVVATVPESTEILVVDDHSDDASSAFLSDQARVRLLVPPARAGVAEARNYGAAHARGEVLVFCDAHVSLPPGWLPPLCAELADPSVAAVAPTVGGLDPRRAQGFGFTWADPSLTMAWLRKRPDRPVDVPFLCGCFMVFRREDFELVGGFDPGMVTWGSEDAEICLNLWRRDRASRVVPQSTVGHLFRSTFPYAVPSQATLHNTLRMATVHLGTPGLSATIGHMAERPAFPEAYAALLDSGVWQRREDVAAASRHDGAWFADRFRLDALR